MQALVNEPAMPYGQATTQPSIGGFFSMESGSSSIYLSPQIGFSDRIAELFQKLNRIGKLAHNWDSYQAAAPSPAAITKARNFLIDNHTLALPFYFLAPGVNGEILIEFQEDGRSAELYFLPDGQTELILFEKDEVALEGSLAHHFRDLLDFFNA